MVLGDSATGGFLESSMIFASQGKYGLAAGGLYDAYAPILRCHPCMSGLRG